MAKIESLMLANHAEAPGGLLYVSGAGWSHHFRGPGIPGQARPPSQLGVAAIFRFEEAEVGRALPVIIRIVSTSDQDVIRIDGEMTVAPGSREPLHRTVFAANFGLNFPSEGGYELVCELPGLDQSRIPFWVHDSVPGGGQEQSTTPGSMPGYV